jgi:sugar/nucleoside kinase (ribokinase family)
MEKQFDILGIGVSVCDIVLVVDELPQEESVVRAEERSVGLGGGVAVAVATAGVLGGRVALADQLGTDPMSDTIVSALERASIDLRCLNRSDEHTASVASVLVKNATGSRTIVFAPGSESELSWTDEIAALVSDSKIIHMTGRHKDVCHNAIRVANQSGTLVSFDGGAHRYREEVMPFARKSDVLIVAEHFARAHWMATHPSDSQSHVDQLSGKELVEFFANDFNAQIVGVTCGEQGSWLAVRDCEPWHQKAIPAHPVRDTTGCGDTFHGAFLLGLAKGMDPVACGEIASLVAAKNAESLGSFAIEKHRECAEIRDAFAT